METTERKIGRSARAAGVTRVRLRRGELVAGAVALAAVGIFYVGPVVLQASLGRRPPEASIRDAALPQLPAELRIGEWRKVTAVYATLDRKRSAGDGAWSVTAVVTMEQTVDLYRAADFAAQARAVRDDSAAFEAALRQAAGLPAGAAPEPPPVGPPIFSKASSSRDVSTAEVELTGHKLPVTVLAPPVAIWGYWQALLGEGRGWVVYGLPTIAIPGQTEDVPRDKSMLPEGALIVGDAAADKAISEYHAARAAYVAAVESGLAKQGLAAIDSAIRAEVARQVGEFYPRGGWSVESVGSIGTLSSGGGAASPVAVALRRTQPLYAEASDGERARLLAPSPEFVEARKTAEQLFPRLAASWPQEPRLYVVSRPRGEVLRRTALAVMAGGNGAPSLGSVSWDGGPVNRSDAEGVPASDIAKGAVVLDGEAAGLATPAEWQRLQGEAVAAVRAEEKGLDGRFGGDRAAWPVLQRAFLAVGGEERLRGQTGFVERVHGKFSFTKSEPEGTGTVSHSLPFRRKEKFELSAKGRRFEYVNSLHLLGAWQQIGDAPISVQSRRGVEDALRRAFAENLLWHLADKDGHFDVKASPMPDAGASTLLVNGSNLPEIAVEVDRGTGYVLKVSYTDSLTKPEKPRALEWRYAKHIAWPAGMVRPQVREFLVDGEVTERYEVLGVDGRQTPDEAFRHPVAGPPFRGRPGAAAASLTIKNAYQFGMVVVVDDSDDTLFIRSQEQASLSLPEGTHTISAETTVPQFVIGNATPTERFRQEFRVVDGAIITLSVARGQDGKVRWSADRKFGP